MINCGHLAKRLRLEIMYPNWKIPEHISTLNEFDQKLEISGYFIDQIRLIMISGIRMFVNKLANSKKKQLHTYPEKHEQKTVKKNS